MHWLLIVIVFTAVVAVAWIASQRSASVQAEGRLAMLAAKVGGVRSGLSVFLAYRGMPAEGTVVEDRYWEREGRVSRIIKSYVWKVRLITPAGSRTAYHRMISAEAVPEPEEFLAQLAQLAEQNEQG